MTTNRWLPLEGVGPLRSGASGVEFDQVSHKMTNEPRLGNGLGGLCQKPQRLIEVQFFQG